MTVVVPTGLEGLQQAFATLGAGIGAVVFEDHNKKIRTQEFLKQNPGAIGALIAPVLDEVDRQIGEDEGLAASRPFMQQSAVVELMEGMGLHASYAPNVTQFGEAFRSARTLEERVAADLAGDPGALEAKEKAMRAGLEGELTEQEARKPIAAAAAAEAEFTEAIFKGRQGQVEGILDLEELQRQAQMQGFEFDIETGKAYQEFLDELKADPKRQHEYQMALNGIKNPTFVQHIGLHEQLAMNRIIAGIRATGDPMEKLMQRFTLAMKVRSELNDSLDRLQAANEAGDDDMILAAIADVNNVGALHTALANSGLMPTNTMEFGFQAAADRGFFSTEGEAQVLPVFSEMQQIQFGLQNPEQYKEIFGTEPPTRQAVMQSRELTPQQKSLLLLNMSGRPQPTPEDEEILSQYGLLDTIRGALEVPFPTVLENLQNMRQAPTQVLGQPISGFSDPTGRR